MTAYVALLRGLNVGQSKRVPMAELRRLTEELGDAEVKTLPNSGNVVFTRRKRAPTLASELAAVGPARRGPRFPRFRSDHPVEAAGMTPRVTLRGLRRVPGEGPAR